VLGGIYGIGGGAIIAPFLVAFYGLPVHAVAGAALMGTFVTSIAGVFVYQLLAGFYSGMVVAPDWQLGLLFGIGGFCGMYCGARFQKYFSGRLINCILCICLFFISSNYIYQFFS